MITRFVIWNGKEGVFLRSFGGLHRWTDDFDKAIFAPSKEVANEMILVAKLLEDGEQLIARSVLLSRDAIQGIVNERQDDLAEYKRLLELCVCSADFHPLTNQLIEKERALLNLVIEAIKNDITRLGTDLEEAKAASAQ